jgi:hypothetical protein
MFSTTNPQNDSRSNEDEDDDDQDVFDVEFKKENYELDGTWSNYIRRLEKSSNSENLKLTGLIFKNFIIKKQHSTLFLPLLRKFVLDLHMQMDSAEFHRFVDLFDLRIYFFFIKKEDTFWKFEELWIMNIQLELIINGVTFFKMDRKNNQEVTINFSNDHAAILSGMVDLNSNDSKNLEKLNLATTDIPSVGFATDNLREICLYKVYDNCEPGLVASFLKRCQNLEKLSCCVDKEKLDSDSDKSKINLAHDLISKNLKRLALSKIQLLFNPATLKIAKKEHVEELYTNFVHFSPMIFEKFDLLFPSLKRVSFRKCESEQYDNKEKLLTSVNVRLLSNIIFKIKSIEWIRVWGFDWTQKEQKPSPSSSKKTATTPPTNNKIALRNTALPITHVEEFTLKSLLKSSGIKVNSQDFLLVKDAKTGIWKGTQYDGKGKNAEDNG